MLARLRARPIRSWSYRAEPQAVRHLGPAAQDLAVAAEQRTTVPRL